MATDPNESDSRFSDPHGSTGSNRTRASYKMDLANAPIDEDFAEEVERLTNSRINNTGCEFADWTRYIDGISDLVHDKCYHLKKKNNISIEDAELLFKLGPVFREVIESPISPDLSDNPNMAQNQYEWKARKFLFDHEYVLSKYFEIHEDEPDFVRYKVDEDFVNDWYYHIYPEKEQDMERGSWWRWSWSDEGWLNSDDD